jgi:hypothetical protein
MLVRFRQTAAGLQCSLVETRRIDDAVRYEQVASFGPVPASPSVADRIAFWRRVYETLAELASRIDADTQGKIISTVHSRIPIVTPNEQRVLRVRPRPQPEKALRHEGAKERPQNKPPISGSDAGTLPFPRVPSLPMAEHEGMQPPQSARKLSPMTIEKAARFRSGWLVVVLLAGNGALWAVMFFGTLAHLQALTAYCVAGLSDKLANTGGLSPIVRGAASMQQVADWLEKLGLGQYARRFAENGIDFSGARIFDRSGPGEDRRPGRRSELVQDGSGARAAGVENQRLDREELNLDYGIRRLEAAGVGWPLSAGRPSHIALAEAAGAVRAERLRLAGRWSWRCACRPLAWRMGGPCPGA